MTELKTNVVTESIVTCYSDCMRGCRLTVESNYVCFDFAFAGLDD